MTNPATVAHNKVIVVTGAPARWEANRTHLPNTVFLALLDRDQNKLTLT
jgi:hypothetical protein